MERVLDGVYSGLKYAFALAAGSELYNLAEKSTLHAQPLTSFQDGVILGAAAGAVAYAFANRNTAWLEGGTIPGGDELARQTDGKVVGIRSGGPKSYPL